jgi:hypothetical protein
MFLDITINITNSNNQYTGGTIKLCQQYIEITNNTKPTVVINDKSIVDKCSLIYEHNHQIKETGGNSKLKYIVDEDLILRLYDEYYLMISEIATLMSMSYYKTNNIINKLPIKTYKSEGRRNTNFNIPTSKEKASKMAKALMGRTSPNKGKFLSTEVKEKIRATLVRKNASGEIVQDGMKQSLAWQNEKYKGVVFNNGYTGYFTSIKYNNTVCFRSLLELAYFIKWEYEEHKSVLIEPFIIPISCDGKNSCYVPDALVDDKYLIEIKPTKLLECPRNEKDKIRLVAEIKYAEQYAKDNGLIFKILTEKDIKFRWDSFKKYLNNSLDLVSKYNIIFTNRNPIIRQYIKTEELNG